MPQRWMAAGLLLLILAGGIRGEEEAEGERAVVLELPWASGPPEAYPGRTLELRYDGGSAVTVTVPFGPDAELAIGHGASAGHFGVVLDRDFDGDLDDEKPIDFQFDEPDFGSGFPSSLKDIDFWIYGTARVHPPWAADAGLSLGVRVFLRLPMKEVARQVTVKPLLHREGEVVLGGRLRTVMVVDGNADLRFDDPEHDAALIDLDGDGAIALGEQGRERVRPGEAFAVRGGGYVFAVEDPWANRVRFESTSDVPAPQRTWDVEEPPEAGVEQKGESRSLYVIEQEYEEKKRDLGRKARSGVVFSSLAEEAGKIGSDDAFAFLERLYQAHDADAFRRTVLAAMGDVRYRAHADRLIRLAGRVRSRGLCLAAISALHRMDAPGREKVLLAMAKKTKHETVFRVATQHLAYVGGEKAQKGLLGLLARARKDPRRAGDLYHAATRYFPSVPDDVIRLCGSSGSVGLRARALLDARALPYPEGRDLALRAVRDAKTHAKLREPVVEVLGGVGDVEAVRALLPLAPLVSDDLRARMGELLGRTRGEKATAALLDALSDSSSEVRWVAATAARRLMAAALPALLATRIEKEDDPRVKAALIHAARRQEAAEAVPVILDVVAEEAAPKEVLEAAISAMLKLGFESEPAAAFLAAQAETADWAYRLRIVDAAATSASERAVPILLAALDDELWSIRLVAIQGLVRHRSKEAVPSLIARLEQEERGRMRSTLARALYRLTGTWLYDVAERWQRWWKDHGADFEVPETVPPLPDVDPGEVYGDFYGVPVDSEHVVFVIDQSGSMESPVKTTGPGSTEFERAVAETLEVVSRLPSGAHVSVILFESELHLWKPELTVLTERTRKELRTFLEEKEPMGGTNLYGGVATAIRMADVDTVYLLSDGMPSAGEYVEEEDILREVEDLNGSVRATIHTVALGMDSPLLEKLAEMSGGTHVRR